MRRIRPDLRRRALLGGALASLTTAPALARAHRPLRFVPQTGLLSLDPIADPNPTTICHGYYVFDTLFGTDAQMRPRPQMAEGAAVSADGLQWRITLRPGLQFHDGSPVLARDCIASLQRWAVRDLFGQMLASFVAEWEQASDAEIVIRLHRPFPLLLHALGNAATIVPFIMPARLAATDPYQPVREMVGSGPYRFLPDAFVPGARAAYARFATYQPRSEPADGTAGGKRAAIAQIEWQALGDPATAASALAKREVDWLDLVQPDLVPYLRRQPDLVVARASQLGNYGWLSFNHHNPPFNDLAVRQAVMLGVRQQDFLQALTGGDATLFNLRRSFLGPGSPGGGEAEPFAPRYMTGDLTAARAALRASRYNGELVVILNAADITQVAPLGPIAEDYFRQLGLNVQLHTSDWSAVAKRRMSRKPAAEGGWSALLNAFSGGTLANPIRNATIRGLGDKGTAGWYADATMEQDLAQWIAATTPAERSTWLQAMQSRAAEQVPSVPLGQFFMNTAYSCRLQGFLGTNYACPWNLSWVDAS